MSIVWIYICNTSEVQVWDHQSKVGRVYSHQNDIDLEQPPELVDSASFLHNKSPFSSVFHICFVVLLAKIPSPVDRIPFASLRSPEELLRLLHCCPQAALFWEEEIRGRTDGAGNMDDGSIRNRDSFSGWWFGIFFIFPYVYIYIYIVGNNHPIPADVLIFQRVAQPPTRLWVNFWRKPRGSRGTLPVVIQRARDLGIDHVTNICPCGIAMADPLRDWRDWFFYCCYDIFI